jgi:hypothetical protein
MPTPSFSYVSRFDRVCCAEAVSNLVNRPVVRFLLISFSVTHFTLAQYPGRFLPIEKIGEEMGWPHYKRLVKIGEKDWKKDWQKIEWFFFCPHHA